jgi:sugar phosphate isomerase/epimerase
MKRRKLIKLIGTGAAGVTLSPGILKATPAGKDWIPLGGPVFTDYQDPEEWIGWLKTRGYTAATAPVEPGEDELVIRKYEQAALKHDIVISEVGAWSNPISPHEEEAAAAVEKCMAHLQLADQIGARCCVNISGSRNPEHWAGPHKDNMTEATFDLVVENTRKIIDAVKPSRTYFTLEAMPWSYPWSTASYLKLLKAVDRKAFAVHLDPVNMITSPQDYYRNSELIKEMFRELGPHIRSCHAKDITLREDNYIPQLDECMPGLGMLDYRVFLKELSRLDRVPLMMEHLQTDEEYMLAAEYIRGVGKEIQIEVR